MIGKAHKLQTSLYFKKLKIEIRVFCKKNQTKNPNSTLKSNQGKKQQTLKKRTKNKKTN